MIDAGHLPALTACANAVSTGASNRWPAPSRDTAANATVPSTSLLLDLREQQTLEDIRRRVGRIGGDRLVEIPGRAESSCGGSRAAGHLLRDERGAPAGVGERLGLRQVEARRGDELLDRRGEGRPTTSVRPADLRVVARGLRRRDRLGRGQGRGLETLVGVPFDCESPVISPPWSSVPAYCMRPGKDRGEYRDAYDAADRHDADRPRVCAACPACHAPPRRRSTG